MGQTGTRLAKKVISPVTRYWYGENNEGSDYGLAVSRFGATPFVYKRTGSMYFDEDGDLAHEFYEEVTYYDEEDEPKAVMEQIRSHLVPQGEIELAIPRINYNLPFIICEAPPR